jgi:hypothetical protein
VTAPSTNDDSSSVAPPSTREDTASRKIDDADPATSATGSSSLVPPEDAASAESLASTEARAPEGEAGAGDVIDETDEVQEDARHANYGRGNLEVGARASVGSPADESMFEPVGEQAGSGSGTVQGDATAQETGDLDASELGTLEDIEPAAAEAAQDPPPEQPAGLSAADLVAGASNNLTSAQQTPSADPTTDAGDDTSSTPPSNESQESEASTTPDDAAADDEQYSSSDAFDSVDSVGIFGLSDSSPTDLDYLSSSESERFNFDTVSSNDIGTDDDFDASSAAASGSPTVLTDQPSGGTAAASEMAPEDIASTEPSSWEDETAVPFAATESGSEDGPSEPETTTATSATADPETLLSESAAPSSSTEGDTAPSDLIEASSSESLLDDTTMGFSESDSEPVEGGASTSSDAAPAQATSPASRDAASTGSGPTASGQASSGNRVKGTDGVCPPDFPIKGNASSKVYHVPGLPSYEKTRAEWCFPTEEDAVSFGYRAPGGHRNQVATDTGGSDTQPTGLQHAASAETMEITPPVAEESLDSPGNVAPPTTTIQHTDNLAPETLTDKEESSIPDGAVAGDGTRTCPVDYPVKGNGGSMIYHLPGTSSYDNTIPEWCFATEDSAIAAGFRAPRRR